MGDPEVEDITCWGGIQLPNLLSNKPAESEGNDSDQ